MRDDLPRATPDPAAPRFIDRHGRPHTLVPGFAREIMGGEAGAAAAAAGYTRALDAVVGASVGGPGTGGGAGSGLDTRAGVGPGSVSVGDRSAADRSASLARVESRVRLGVHTLGLLAPEAPDADVLVVGADRGEECLWLAHAGAERVTGSNLTDVPGGLGDPMWESYRALASARAEPARALPSSVAMVRDDLCSSTLASASFDRIYSWQTLEHVGDPASALREVARLLRPGGAAYFEYNPFFSVDGAHWIALTDLPWAHARLDGDDFARLLDETAPGHDPSAAPFVSGCINRVSMGELRRHASDAGLRVLALVPRTRTEDLLRLDAETLGAVRRLHPGADAPDLVSRIVRVVLGAPR